MTPEELNMYKMLGEKPDQEVYIHASDYRHGGTLLYGYTPDRETFHVYVRDGKIVRVIYNSIPHIKVIDLARDVKLPVDMLIPAKRAYPDRTLLTFALDVFYKGRTIPFTTMADNAEPLRTGDYVGLVV